MKKKIIFLDVDSTLYSHKTNSIPISTINAIKEAKKNGHLIALATGRSALLTSFLGIFDVIDFDYFVTINGTLVFDKDMNIIFQKPIDKESINKVINITNNHKLNLVFITSDSYFLLHDEDKQAHLGYDPLHIKLPKKKKYENEVIYQINIFCEDKFLPFYLNETSSTLSYSKLNNYGYDVYAKNQSKATGILHLINYLGIDISDTIAIGDGHNDKEMIELCNIGIAMGNSIPKVKEVSNYITTDIDDNGIYNALKHFNII